MKGQEFDKTMTKEELADRLSNTVDWKMAAIRDREKKKKQKAKKET